MYLCIMAINYLNSRIFVKQNQTEIDFETERTATSQWLSESESFTDLSIILRVSMKYADCNNEKHTKHQMIELYKVCYDMASSSKDHVTEKAVKSTLPQ